MNGQGGKAAPGRVAQRPVARRRLWPPSPALALFVFLASLYVLTSGGHTYSYDEETMFALTESLVERGSVEIPSCGPCLIIGSDPAPGGRNYSRYGPLQSLAATPLYALGRLVAGDDPVARWFTTRFFAVLLNALITAGTATVLYGLARSLAYSPRVALATALLYGLGSQAWPRAKTFFAEPLTTLLLLGAVACWWQLERRSRESGVGSRESDEGRPRTSRNFRLPTPDSRLAYAAGVGLCCGLALATKWGAAIALPVLGLAGAVTLLRWWRAGLPPRAVFGVALSAAVGLAVPVGLVLAYNYARFGSPWETGYGAGEVAAIQSGDPWTPLRGFLVSPGKSIFLFSPVVALALPAWPLFARRHRALALVVAGLVAAHLAFYTRVPYWHGDVIWGPRYLDYVLPLLVLPLASGLAWLAARRGAARRLVATGGALVVAVAVAVQLLAIAVNFDTAYISVRPEQWLWDWSSSPPLLHARLLRERGAAWAAVRFPREDGVTPGRGFDLLNEEDPPWPRFLPAEARLHVHAGGSGAISGAFVYEDARERRDPPLRLTVLVDGRPADAREERAPETGNPAAYRLSFTIRPEGGSGADYTVTLRNESFAQLGRTRLLAFQVTAGGAELPVHRRPMLLPFPDGDTERWAWFLTERNQHLADIWPWYVAVLGLPASLVRQLLVAVGGGALLGLAVGLAGLRACWRQGAAGSQPWGPGPRSGQATGAASRFSIPAQSGSAGNRPIGRSEG